MVGKLRLWYFSNNKMKTKLSVEKLWLREFRKSAVLELDEDIAHKFAEEELFVPNYKYFDVSGVKMIDGELGYLFIHPHFVRIVIK